MAMSVELPCFMDKSTILLGHFQIASLLVYQQRKLCGVDAIHGPGVSGHHAELVSGDRALLPKVREAGNGEARKRDMNLRSNLMIMII